MKELIFLFLFFPYIINKLVTFSPEEDDVILLSDSNYSKIINETENLVILSYARWCKYSSVFKPEYLNTIKLSKEKKFNLTFAVIETSLNKNYKEEFSIVSYPTIKIFKKEVKNITFNGEKNSYSLYKFLDKEVNGRIKTFNTLKEIDDYIKENKIVLLNTYSKENINYKSFSQISIITSIYDFIECFREECIKKYKEDFILFKHFDEPIIFYSEKETNNNQIDFSSLLTFLTVYSVELGGKYSERYFNLMFGFYIPTIIYFRDSNNKEQISKDNIIKNIHLKYREDYFCFVYDLNDESINKYNKIFYVQKNEIPLVMFIKNYEEDNMDRYIMKDKEINEENIIKFIDDVNNNKLLKDLNSQSPPSDIERSQFSYHLVIGKTYDKEIMDEKEKNIVLFLTNAYFCFKCDDASTIINELAIFYQNNTFTKDKIKFCQMDLLFNEMRESLVQNITQYPAFVLYLKNNKNKPIIYDGNINKDDIENWILNQLNWNKNDFNEEKEKSDL